ncbi:MAG: division/cell wall cluster transcriptional repressor MraZ [Elusimicrobiota bacterium]|jgi:MraZ protein
MTVTIGQYEYSLDPKNRLVVPPRYREALHAEKAPHFILAIGQDQCLWLFLPSQWEAFLEDAKSLSREVKDKAKARAARRHLFSSAVEAPLDDQGRVLVPQNLKDYAALAKDVVVVGAGNKAEIWSRGRWTEYSRKQAAPSFSELAKDLDL